METEYEAKSGLPPPTTAGSSNRKKRGEKNKDMKKPSETLPFRRAFSCLPQILKNKTESIKSVSFGF